ncbi:MAG: tRNA pseudouridine(55) synthase TruB [Pseudomonadota bacterium]
MGRRRKGRPINGILLLDKPTGITSNAALQTAKRALNAQKAGHTGSLDPLATGLLPLCFGEATKVSAYLLDADKSYEAEILLGITTTTGDSDGEVVKQNEVGHLTHAELSEVLKDFEGEIEQVPPMYSALKKDGQPLYKLARRGVEVARDARTIRIFALELLSFDGRAARVRVHCSKGTYIRQLAEDIGSALHTGGHITALRRTEVGPFKLDGAIKIEELDKDLAQIEAKLLNPDQALGKFPAVSMTLDSANNVMHGAVVRISAAPKRGMVRMYDSQARFLGIGEITADGCVAPRRIMRVAE